MRILSRALGLCVLMAAAPLAAGTAGAASASPAAPYHLTSAFGHGPLQPAGWSGRDDRRDDRRGDRWHKHHVPRSWGAPQFGRGHLYGAPRLLPGWVVENRLRHQSFRPIGRMSLRHGVYVVPAIDPWGRRVLLSVDPATAVILGRKRLR